MISCDQKDHLYLSDQLPLKHPRFFQRFRSVLDQQKVNWAFLPGTKDIWAEDYMPVQVNPDKYINFVYNPDYLRRSNLKKTISNASRVCQLLEIPIIESDIVLDGGNIIVSPERSGRNQAIIMCDKIFRENPHYTEKKLIEELERLLETDKLVFIPTDFYDVYGHADGLTRFLDADTVLINSYTRKDGDFPRRLRLSLHNAGLNYIEIPYNMANNTHYHQANGAYINYLQIKDLIVLPVFGFREDEVAIKQFETLFTDKKIVILESNEIAREGGVLNCVSWYVLRK